MSKDKCYAEVHRDIRREPQRLLKTDLAKNTLNLSLLLDFLLIYLRIYPAIFKYNREISSGYVLRFCESIQFYIKHN